MPPGGDVRCGVVTQAGLQSSVVSIAASLAYYHMHVRDVGLTSSIDPS